jgi:hypothetical protein
LHGDKQPICDVRLVGGSFANPLLLLRFPQQFVPVCVCQLRGDQGIQHAVLLISAQHQLIMSAKHEIVLLPNSSVCLTVCSLLRRQLAALDPGEQANPGE